MSFFTESPSIHAQSAGQAFHSASSGRRRGYDAGSPGKSDGTKNLFEDIRQWRASSAKEFLDPEFTRSRMNVSASESNDSMFSSAREPMASQHPDFIYYPSSPPFNPGDLLTQSVMGGPFSTSFGTTEPPPMEFSASSGAATGSLHDFPGSEGSLSGEAPSPNFFQAETASEGDVPYLDMYVGQAPWSPSSASVELSIPSATASGAMLPPGMMESPTSFSPAEEFASKFSTEDGLLTQFTLESSPFGSSPYDCIDLGSSQLQLGDNYQPGPQIPLAAFGSTFGLPPRTKAFYSNRLSSDGENIKARQHELYNVGPGRDNLYHCPFAADGCLRKPDKLKCNYDKHMDSHLKPYRCQDPQCADVPFSSTACLLRHEREAHGLHGHGDRPYLCHFQDCERAVLGHGFPRRWNLQDHMRRVHNYVEPDTDATANQETNRVRKKKTAPAQTTSGRRGSRALPSRSRA